MSKLAGGPMETFWGYSSDSIEGAIKNAVEAAKVYLLKQYPKPDEKAILEWFELIETRGHFSYPDASAELPVIQYQIAIRIGYKVVTV